MRARKQHSHITNKTFNISDILNNYESFCLPRKKKRLAWFKECFPVFLDKADPNDEESFKDFDYFKYLMAARTKMRDGVAVRTSIRVMRGDLRVYNDIKTNGLKKPLDMRVLNGEYVLHRGYRRLFKIAKLGYTKVPCRVFKNKDYFDKLVPTSSVKPRGIVDAVGMQQFQKDLDKGTDKYWLHNYTPLYSAHLSGLEPEKVLELGVKGGASLRLWSKVFPNAKVYGLDFKPCPGMDEFTIFQGDQADPVLMAQVASNGPFNIIVDDASHDPKKTAKSLEYLWDSVASGGWYIIEDTHLNYRGDNVGTTMRRLKGMIDEMNRTCDIKSMHFYYNICFIQKT